jgi:6-phosphogluconate dehydrogenase
MGLNMVTRLLNSGEHELVVYNRSTSAIDDAVKLGAVGCDSIADLVEKLGTAETPKVVWLMIPSGAPVDGAIEELIPLLSKGDTIVDGGNSNYKETVARAAMLKEHGIDYLDVGTSGGIWGLKVGYCMMIGGEQATFERLEPALKTLAPPNGYSHMGASGAGHYVKMIHNGIEYGMLQAYAEGFALMEASDYGLDLKNIATLWNQGSVVRSWLLELTEGMFEKNPKLDGIKDYVADSGEGRWTILDSMDKDIPCPVITLSLLQRFESRLDSSFSAKVIAGLRDEFGGHGVKK